MQINGDINKTLVILRNANKQALYNVVKQWLKKNVEGKYLIASDGKKIEFTANESTWHLAFDGSDEQKYFVARTIPYIVDVFRYGIAKGRQELTKDRSNKKVQFVCFYVYEKTVKIGDKKVKLRAKAGETESGKIEVFPKIIAYTQYVLNDKNKPQVGSKAQSKKMATGESKFRDLQTARTLTDACGLYLDNSLILDSTQEESALEILSVQDIEDNTQQILDGLFKHWGI